MAIEARLTSSQVNNLFKFLAAKDLESRAGSFFSRTARKIDSCLDAIELNGRQFSEAEKDMIANAAGNVIDRAAVRLINENLIFLADRNQNNPELLEKIHYIRKYLAVDNKPCSFEKKVKFDGLAEKYKEFEIAVPKWDEFVNVERGDLYQQIRALTKFFRNSNSGSVFLFMFLVLERKYDSKFVMEEFFKFVATKEFERKDDGSVGKYEVLDLVMEFININVGSSSAKVVYDMKSGLEKNLEVSRSKVETKTEDCKFNQKFYDTLTIKKKLELLANLKSCLKAGNGIEHLRNEDPEHKHETEFYARVEREMKLAAAKQEFVMNTAFALSYIDDEMELLKRIKENDSVVSENVSMSQIPNLNEYLTKLKYYYAKGGKEDHLLHFSAKYIDGKMVDVPVSKEEMEFYEQQKREIRKAAEAQGIADEDFPAFALKYIGENRFRELIYPAEFYGTKCPDKDEKELPIVIQTAMSVDDESIRRRYEECLVELGLSADQPLPEERVAALHQEIEEKARTSELILDQAAKRTSALLDQLKARGFFDAFVRVYQQEIPVEKVHKNDTNNAGGARYEEMKEDPVIYQLRDREMLLKEQLKKSEISLPEFNQEMEVLQNEREAIFRILDIMCTEKRHRGIRKLKSPEEVYQAVKAVLLGMDGKLDIDLPISFPRRAHIYLDQYHGERVQKQQQISGPAR